MRLLPFTIATLCANLLLASCSSISTSNQPSQAAPMGPTVSESNIIKSGNAGGIETTLDSYDQEKMSHALDKPLGKTSDWSNPRTGIMYSVTPTGKIAFNGNPYCRKYTITSSRQGNRHESAGTACVSATDSSWQIVN